LKILQNKSNYDIATREQGILKRPLGKIKGRQRAFRGKLKRVKGGTKRQKNDDFVCHLESFEQKRCQIIGLIK
jgi:hypothetical protein